MVFDKNWFKKYNKQITFVARFPFVGELIFNFKKFGHYIDRKKIVEVTPNSVVEFVGWKKGKVELRQHFFVRNEYALRLQSVFYPIWITFHIWDILTRPIPQLNLGFDTLTQYPGSIGANNPVDGHVAQYAPGGTGISWSAVRNGSGNYNNYTGDTATLFSLDGFTSAGWEHLYRAIFLFDTSSLTSGATISATVLSLHGSSKQNYQYLDPAPNIDIYTSAPASDSSLANGDYDSLGTTSQTGSPITYASYSISAYNAFTLNATGRGNVSKTGISKFGTRNANYDVANSEPTQTGASSSNIICFSSDYGSNKPKLVVTYTAAVGPANVKTYKGLAAASVKTLKGLEIASVKTKKGLA